MQIGDCVQDSDFAGDLEDSKSTSGGTLCIFGSPHICSKKLDVQETNISFSQFNESEIVSLDTGLRLDGLPALELWDLIVSVLGNVSRVSDGSGKPESDVHQHGHQGLMSVIVPINDLQRLGLFGTGMSKVEKIQRR